MKLAPVLAAILLAGCAADDARYPSLAPRAAEKQGFDEPAVTAPAPAAADPALDAQLATLRGRLDAIAKGFDADARRAEAGAAAAGARTVGSEAWITAQTALASLDDWRAQASGLATEIESLAGERIGISGTPYPALETLRQRATAEAAREGATIARIGARLPLP